MKHSFYDYDFLLLDMNGTFLVDFDNFDPDQDFAATYDGLGYTSLAAEVVQQSVRNAYEYLAERYADPRYYDCFPSVAQAVSQSARQRLSEQEVHELVDTFAVHEFGRLTDDHERALRHLASKFPLTVLSNLWAPKARWLSAFKRWGIASLFGACHFSSDGPNIKPSAILFQRALSDIGSRLGEGKTLYIGDSYRCDVLGAQGAGIDCVWLTGDDPSIPTPDQSVAQFRNLVDFAAALSSS